MDKGDKVVMKKNIAPDLSTSWLMEKYPNGKIIFHFFDEENFIAVRTNVQWQRPTFSELPENSIAAVVLAYKIADVSLNRVIQFKVSELEKVFQLQSATKVNQLLALIENSHFSPQTAIRLVLKSATMSA